MTPRRVALAVLVVGLLAGGLVLAAANGLVQSALTGGGGRSESDGAVLRSSVGQALTGRSDSGDAVLCSGWPGCQGQLSTPLQADFSAIPLTGAAPLTVTFTNLTGGPLVSCQWVFGDGGSSNSCADLEYTYNSEGTYTVTLTVHGGGQTDTRVRPDYIVVSDEQRIYLPWLQAPAGGE